MENQINDRISFKVFIGLPFGDPSPDHSVICRYREWVGSGCKTGTLFIEAFGQGQDWKDAERSGAEEARRDRESDWTVKNDIPVYGMNEHAALDVKSGLVLSTVLSRASKHDTNYFQYVVIKGIHTRKQPPNVYAEDIMIRQIGCFFTSISCQTGS